MKTSNFIEALDNKNSNLNSDSTANLKFSNININHVPN